MSNGRRTSERWSLNGRPNFKEMSDGKKFVFSEKGGGSIIDQDSRKKLLWEGLTCTLYEEIMHYMRSYEKAFDCKLNASMVTLKLRQGRPDYQYYRSITFWCSYCIQGGKPLMSPSLGLAQRFCPFLVVVNGDSNKGALVVTQIFPDHQHLPHVSSDISLAAANPRPFNASPVAPNPAHSVIVPVNSHELPKKENERKSISPPKGGKKISTIIQPSKSSSLKRQSSSSSSSQVAKPSHNEKSKHNNSEIEDLLPHDVACQLCNFKSRSKNAFTGHVWLTHKLLTDFVTF